MSRKLLTASVALLAAVGLASPGQASSAQRTQVETYEAGAGVRQGSTVAIWSLPLQTWATFQTQPGDKKAHIEVRDLADTVSLIHVHVDRGSDMTYEVDRDFCATEVDLKVSGDTTIEVFPLTGTCHDGTVSLASRGDIEATFSR